MPPLSRWIALLFCSAALLHASEAKLHIAVIDFAADNRFAHDEVQAIAMRMQSELINTDAFIVLDRSQIENILKEQGFQQSGVCTSSDCQIEMGQMLGVERLVTGHLGRVGGLITFNLNLINVQSGQIVRSLNRDVAGGLETILTVTCRELALELVAATGSTAPLPLPAKPASGAPSTSAAAPLLNTGTATPSTTPGPAAANATAPSSAPKKSRAWLWWTLGGLAVAGGGAAVILSQQGTEPKVSSQFREPSITTGN